MREILFRGKRVDDGEWVYGDVSFNRKGEPAIRYWPTAENKTYQVEFVDPSTVGQFTGLKDNNGKKIFEGDVVTYREGRFVVEWVERYCRFSGRNADTVFAGFAFDRCEVIGNIHNNPELPEGGN